MKTFTKQPGDHLDYQINLTQFLADGEEVENVEVEAPDGIELSSVSIMPSRVKLWIKGGMDGENYHFQPRIKTRHRTKEVDLLIIVVEM